MSSKDKNGDLDSDWIQKTTRPYGFVMEEKWLIPHPAHLPMH